MIYRVTHSGKTFTVDISEANGKLQISVNGRQLESAVESDHQHQKFLMLLDNHSFDTEVFRADGTTQVFMLGREFDCHVIDERLASIREQAGIADHHRSELRAPMPGLVTKLLHQVGDNVKKGDPVIIVEAMKMENELRAPSAGTVAEIAATVGKPVDKGQVLMTFDAVDAAAIKTPGKQ